MSLRQCRRALIDVTCRRATPMHPHPKVLKRYFPWGVALLVSRALLCTVSQKLPLDRPSWIKRNTFMGVRLRPRIGLGEEGAPAATGVITS